MANIAIENSLLLKMAIEIVDFPMNSMDSYVNVYQRVIVVDNDDNKLMVNKLMVSSGW